VKQDVVRRTWPWRARYDLAQSVETSFIAKFHSMQCLAQRPATVVESQRCESSKAIVKKSVAVTTLVASLASATPHAQDAIVPIEQEPKHVLKFQNKHVRFFDVQLPPGYQTLWHTHLHDGVFVNIAPAETTAQDLGGTPVARPPRIIGETSFIAYTAKPKAHRVANTGTTPYHVIDTEIHSACGRYTPMADGAGQTLIAENDRARVTRLMLAPGESIPLHPSCGMLVAVDAAQATFRTGGPDEKVALRAGDFKWRDADLPVVLVNEGNSVLHAVDIVVK